MLKYTVYLIDGVKVTERIWERRKLYGEHKAARFTVEEIYNTK